MSPAVEDVPATKAETNQKDSFTIRGGNQKDLEKVEQMIRQCAESGDGFNIDEFCPEDGHFLHKFIHQPKVIVAAGNQGQILAAAIYGFSALTRVKGATFTAYFVVQPKYRRKGIASQLLKKIYQICHENKCKMLLFDIYITNQVAMAWLTREGFFSAGTLPYCGYLANNGYTHSVLMCKRHVNSKFKREEFISQL